MLFNNLLSLSLLGTVVAVVYYDTRRKDKRVIEPFSTSSFISSLCCCVVIVAVSYAGWRYWYKAKATTSRYDFAADAYKSGRGDITAAALAPEIGQGFRSFGEGIGSIFKTQNF
jgi:hypothetical protein